MLTANALHQMGDEFAALVENHVEIERLRLAYLDALVLIATTPRITGKLAANIAAAAVRGDTAQLSEGDA
jgi:hypothetical protein